MKATKKIVGAACALVAAVALSAGSTFAWFSSNSEVEVTGMRLQAVVPDALFIKTGIVTDVANITDTSLDYADENETKLNPATIAAATGEGASGYELKSAATYTTGNEPTGSTPGTAATYEVQGTFNNTSTTFDPRIISGSGETAEKTEPGKYATMYVMSLARINNKMDAKLQAKVEFTCPTKDAADTTDTDNTYKFVRCGFLCGVNGGTSEWTSIENTIVDGDTKCAYDTSTAGTAKVTFNYTGDTWAVCKDFDGNTAYQVQFVVWFDGPDADCFANNALTTHNISVKITYTVEDKA